VIYLRRRDRVGGRELRRVINQELVPAIIGTRVLSELRTQTFLPWSKLTLNTPARPARVAIHAYDVLETLTYVEKGEILMRPHP